MVGDLRDHAEEPPDFVLATDLVDEGEFELQNLATVDASEVPGEYPQYGTFIECEQDGEQVWVECPRGLARALVEQDVEPGSTFVVTGQSGGGQDPWEFDVDVQ